MPQHARGGQRTIERASSVYPVGSRDQTPFFRLGPDLALVEMPLSGCKQCHSFRESDQAPLSPLSLHQGGCTAGTEALGLWDESFMGRWVQGLLLHVPPRLSLLCWVLPSGRGAVPTAGRPGTLLLLSVFLSSRAGLTLPGSKGQLLLTAGDWPFLTSPYSYSLKVITRSKGT